MWLGPKHQDAINLIGRVRANYSRIAAERLDPLGEYSSGNAIYLEKMLE